MLERLLGHEFYCFIDEYFSYNQISITLEDQEKPIVTCPYGTFAFRRIPFRLCNALGTFQQCMMEIFSNMVERSIEIFMDNFFILGALFDDYLGNLEFVLKRCKDTILVLNWEKCHFTMKEGIVLGHSVWKWD